MYHAVEPVTSCHRVSIALFSPKGWKKLLPHSIEELADIGFFPPLSAQAAEAPATADHCPPSLLPSLALPASTSVDSDEPTGSMPQPLTTANEAEEIAVKDWCTCDHVNLPYDSLPRSDFPFE